MFQKANNFHSLLLVSILVTLNSCDNKNHFGEKSLIQNKSTIFSDTSCAYRFKEFAHSIELDTAKSLNFYFDDKKTKLNDCNLRKLRNNAVLQSAVVLIILKIHDRDRRMGNKDFLVNFCMGISETMTSIIQEFAYLVYDEKIKISGRVIF